MMIQDNLEAITIDSIMKEKGKKVKKFEELKELCRCSSVEIPPLHQCNTESTLATLFDVTTTPATCNASLN